MYVNKRTRKNAPHYPAQLLGLIIQTERRYKKKSLEEDIRDDELGEDTQYKDSTNDEDDQDSSSSFNDNEDNYSKPRRRFRRLDRTQNKHHERS